MGNIIKPIKTMKKPIKTKKNEKTMFFFGFFHFLMKKPVFFLIFPEKKTPTLVSFDLIWCILVGIGLII